MKIYDHPLNSSITVIEIEKHDETEEFLCGIINGFDQFGEIYPSSSFEESKEDEKQVIYFDGRKRKVFDDVDVLCALTVGLAGIDESSDGSIADQCIFLAEAAGNQELLERLLSRPTEYFDSFGFIKKSA